MITLVSPITFIVQLIIVATKNKKNKKIKIELTPQQFRDLLLLVGLGTFMKESVDELLDKDLTKTNQTLKSLYRLAYEHGLNNLVEKFENHIVPTTPLAKEEAFIIDTFIEDHFWDALVTHLGKRDFYRSLTDQEKIDLMQNQWLPDKVYEFYQKWEEEFDKHGLERLGIVFGLDLNDKEEDTDTN